MITLGEIPRVIARNEATSAKDNQRTFMFLETLQPLVLPARHCEEQPVPILIGKATSAKDNQQTFMLMETYSRLISYHIAFYSRACMA
jgi:hypothetical protein